MVALDIYQTLLQRSAISMILVAHRLQASKLLLILPVLAPLSFILLLLLVEVTPPLVLDAVKVL